MVARAGGLTIAVLMIVVGAIWTSQGLGYVEGSTMSGERTWATIGPIVAGLGLALVIVIVQAARRT